MSLGIKNVENVESVRSQVSKSFIDLIMIIEEAWKNILELGCLGIRAFCALYRNLFPLGKRKGKGEGLGLGQRGLGSCH